jgi:hypothetical protein
VLLDRQLRPDGVKLWADAKQRVHLVHLADGVVPADQDLGLSMGFSSF